MKAVRLHHYHEQPTIDQVDEPKITGPLDVIVRIGGAGLCRTDLHIIEGQWEEKMHPTLPYTIGHENAGWVHEVGSAVSNVAVGDTVIVHPLVTCGLCRACRAGNDMHCINAAFPGISIDGGMANFLKTSARAVVKLNPSLHPKDIAALADAGRAEYLASSDQEALDALVTLSRTEGIIPALESAHAVAECIKRAPKMKKSEVLIVNISGRGDKDIGILRENLKIG